MSVPRETSRAPLDSEYGDDTCDLCGNRMAETWEGGWVVRFDRQLGLPGYAGPGGLYFEWWVCRDCWPTWDTVRALGALGEVG
jgi:hypothetical protein